MINLTQHKATPEQGEMVAQAVDNNEIRALLNVAPGASGMTLPGQVIGLTDWAEEVGAGEKIAMVGGHAYLTQALTARLVSLGWVVVMAETARESVEARQPDGSVVKRNVFKHCGWRVLGAHDLAQIVGIQPGEFFAVLIPFFSGLCFYWPAG